MKVKGWQDRRYYGAMVDGSDHEVHANRPGEDGWAWQQ